MKIVVCEDAKDDRDALCHFIDKFFMEISCPVEITAYENGYSFLNSLKTEKGHKNSQVKIAFLDIYMPGISGIDVAREIRETNGDMVIIFTTTSVDHGLDGYSVNALQYLVKPIGYEDVKKVLEACAKLFAESMRFIEILSDRLTVRAVLKDIQFVEVYGNVCLIHTAAETIKSYCALEEIERQLDGRMFLRTHRSYIVNMRYIDDVAENDFKLKNGSLIPIRRSDRLTIKQIYKDYLFSQSRGGI